MRPEFIAGMARLGSAFIILVDVDNVLSITVMATLAITASELNGFVDRGND
jgi:hypothetical protein